MENDTLKTIQNDLLYSNKKVSLPAGRDRRKHYMTQTQNVDAVNRTDENLEDRPDKFFNQLQDEYYYMFC